MAIKVLICNDKPEHLEQFEQALSSPEFELRMVSCDDQLFRMAAQFQPERMIIDLVLEDQHSEEFIIRIKNDPMFRDVPVILSSGSFNTERMARSYELANFITRPFEMEEVIHLLREGGVSRDQ